MAPDAVNARSVVLRPRWLGAGAGVLLALCDTWLISGLGVSFAMNGRDAGWLVAAWFGSSLAILGYLLGYFLESRRRERESAKIIRRQMETIQQTRSRLAHAERLASLGQLATAIAHEVRNPLAVIRSAAQGLAEGADAGGSAARPAEIERACAFITAEIDRLTSVIGSLLSFAKPPRLEARRLTVEDLFSRVELLVREELLGRGIRLRRQNGERVPEVTADFDLLCQVLLGLVANAREAVPAGGEIVLEAAANDGRVVISVSDTGPGIPAELRERVFDAFFTTRSRGMGLGLAVARQIVEAHSGTIAVEDRPGVGARFSIRLPAAGGSAPSELSSTWSSTVQGTFASPVAAGGDGPGGASTSRVTGQRSFASPAPAGGSGRLR